MAITLPSPDLFEKPVGDPTHLACEHLILQRLGQHPRIAHCVNAGEDVTKPLFFVRTRYNDLASFMRDYPSVPLMTRVKWALQLAEGLAYIHSRGIIWEDLTVFNILVTAEHDLLLWDFGLCGHVGRRGVEFYSDISMDIFAFGFVLFKMMSYKTPFTDEAAGFQYRNFSRRYESHEFNAISAVVPPPIKLIVDGCRNSVYRDTHELLAATRHAYSTVEQHLRSAGAI